MTKAPSRREPATDRLGEDAPGSLPGRAGAPGTVGFGPENDAVRRPAVDHLPVRSDDGHHTCS
ncbi:hypothetical protein AB0O86_28465 [Streptomyces hirsutus]|uniref:hypothetical protein n=1 Tax=Streptomyces hirsutus TaxID=35620 RepID=UPI003424CD6F